MTHWKKVTLFLSLSSRLQDSYCEEREGDDLLKLGKFLFRAMHGVPKLEKVL